MRSSNSLHWVLAISFSVNTALVGSCMVIWYKHFTSPNRTTNTVCLSDNHIEYDQQLSYNSILKIDKALIYSIRLCEIIDVCGFICTKYISNSVKFDKISKLLICAVAISSLTRISFMRFCKNLILKRTKIHKIETGVHHCPLYPLFPSLNNSSTDCLICFSPSMYECLDCQVSFCQDCITSLPTVTQAKPLKTSFPVLKGFFLVFNRILGILGPSYAFFWGSTLCLQFIKSILDVKSSFAISSATWALLRGTSDGNQALKAFMWMTAAEFARIESARLNTQWNHRINQRMSQFINQKLMRLDFDELVKCDPGSIGCEARSGVFSFLKNAGDMGHALLEAIFCFWLMQEVELEIVWGFLWVWRILERQGAAIENLLGNSNGKGIFSMLEGVVDSDYKVQPKRILIGASILSDNNLFDLGRHLGTDEWEFASLNEAQASWNSKSSNLSKLGIFKWIWCELVGSAGDHASVSLRHAMSLLRCALLSHLLELWRYSSSDRNLASSIILHVASKLDLDEIQKNWRSLQNAQYIVEQNLMLLDVSGENGWEAQGVVDMLRGCREVLLGLSVRGAVGVILDNHLIKFPSVIDFSAKAGEVLGFSGRSGSGKSCMIRALCQFTELKGEILLKGQRGWEALETALMSRNRRDWRRDMVLLVAQHDVPDLNLSPLEAILPRDFAKKEWRESIHLIKKVLHDVDLYDVLFSDTSKNEDDAASRLLAAGGVATLSGGQQQRLLLANLLFSLEFAGKDEHAGKLLLLDEATSALDPQTELQVLQNVRKKVKELGMIAVLVCHRDEVLEQVSDKIVSFDIVVS